MKNNLLNNKVYLTDGGLETTLIFDHGIDLPHFAAFDLINKPGYNSVIRDYYRSYLKLAEKYDTGFILESPTWRSNPDWGYKMGYTHRDLDQINQKAIRDMVALKEEYDLNTPILVSGCVGPRGDGYEVDTTMSSEEATHYHYAQIASFKKAGADMVTAITMTYYEEALGIVRAAKAQDIPVVISFTVETDGKLPSGEGLGETILQLDRETDQYASYYMINCAHPSHFRDVLEGNWLDRIRGIRANASCKSHAELDESTELDPGNRVELAQDYRELNRILPSLKVVGGCCGTDHTHIEHISDSLFRFTRS